MNYLPVLFVLFALAALGWRHYKYHLAAEAWGAVAAEHDLSCSPGGWLADFQMSGEYRGVSVDLETERRRRNKRHRTYTMVRAELPREFPTGIEIYDEGFFASIKKAFGGQDIEVGVPEIDSNFVIQGDRPDEVRELFENPEVVDAFERLATLDRNVHIEFGELETEKAELISNREELEYELEFAVEFCADLRDGLRSEAAAEQPDEELADDEKYATTW